MAELVDRQVPVSLVESAELEEVEPEDLPVLDVAAMEETADRVVEAVEAVAVVVLLHGATASRSLLSTPSLQRALPDRAPLEG